MNIRVLLILFFATAWHYQASAQVSVKSSFDELINQAKQLEAGYFQQELELRREEISLLRQELELKRYEIQLIRKQMEPKQEEISKLREQIAAETGTLSTPRMPRPTIEKQNALIFRWCQVTNIPWRMVHSGGAVVQDGDKLGTYFRHAILNNGTLFVWARC